MTRKTLLLPALLALVFAAPLQAKPEQLDIDEAHTFVSFKVSHIGFAWIPGTFTGLDGELSYDPEKRENSTVKFTVRVPSLTTFHAERDKHLKSDDFFNAARFETATFQSTAYEPTGDDTATLRGKLTIKDVTKPVTFEVKELAGKPDPWGNFRRAFEATGDIKLADFGLDDFGGAASTAEITVMLEATRPK